MKRTWNQICSTRPLLCWTIIWWCVLPIFLFFLLSLFPSLFIGGEPEPLKMTLTAMFSPFIVIYTLGVFGILLKIVLEKLVGNR